MPIIGECRGKNLYTIGSYCPLPWTPSPVSIIQARAGYLAWWRGLRMLSEVLQLLNHDALPPSAPQAPWRDGSEPPPITLPDGGRKPTKVLPLKPQRPIALAPLPNPRSGAVRRPRMRGQWNEKQ
jgi:hypothetical protein